MGFLERLFLKQKACNKRHDHCAGKPEEDEREGACRRCAEDMPVQRLG